MTTITATYCAICEKFASFGRTMNRFFESAGRARAAAELHRQGYTAEAKKLMTEKW